MLLKRIANILSWVVLAHTALFILFWLTNELFTASTNDFLADLLGQPGNYVRWVLVFSAAIGLWSIVRLALHAWDKPQPFFAITVWLYGLVGLFYLLFFYGSFAVLLHESPVQGIRLVQLLSYYRLFLDAIILLGAAALLGLWLRDHPRWQGQVWEKPGWFSFAVCGVYLLAWLLPVIFPPGAVYRGALPTRPRIIAHRGASMLAPENTLVAANLAVELGVYGLETDIHISRDGVPFLMHDDTLKRTTDVAAVFPGREKDRAETFTLAEVQQLNAGQWFVQQDPYQVISRRVAQPDQIEAYRTQKVPTLAEELDIVRQKGMIFIFDLKQPPAGHPFNQAFFDLCLKEIQQAGVDQQIWYLVNRDELAVVRKAAPAMLPAAGIDYDHPPLAADLTSAGYRIVNAEYGLPEAQIRQYQQAGLWVNLYTVDEPWQFSLFWLRGVNSITTSNAGAMVALDHPLFSLPFSIFLFVWSCIGLLGLSVLLLLIRQGK